MDKAAHQDPQENPESLGSEAQTEAQVLPAPQDQQANGDPQVHQGLQVLWVLKERQERGVPLDPLDPPGRGERTEARVLWDPRVNEASGGPTEALDHPGHQDPQVRPERGVKQDPRVLQALQGREDKMELQAHQVNEDHKVQQDRLDRQENQGLLGRGEAQVLLDPQDSREKGDLQASPVSCYKSYTNVSIIIFLFLQSTLYDFFMGRFLIV